MKNQLFKTFLLSFLTIFCCLFSAKSQNIENLINQQDWITRQKQNQIEQEKRVKEKEAIQKEYERKKEEEENQEKSESLKESEQCFKIKSIELIDANSLSKKQQKRLISPFITKCVNVKILSEIVSSIQNYYNKQGYITALALVPKQNIENGELKIQIYEGKIEKIIIGNDNLKEKIQKITAFGFLDGKTLNIKDVDQGIYQINRLSSNSATMKIEPSENEGETKIYIHNETSFPAQASISHNNLGNDFTGIYQTSFSSSIDNLLFLNDSINLNYLTNINDEKKEKNISAFSSSLSIPFGYYTFSYDFSRSEFRGSNEGINQILSITGFSQRNNAGIDRVFYNNGNLRISGNISLTTKSSASYLNKTKIETSERRLTSANFGLAISNYFKNGVNIYLKPSYIQGLKIFDAKKDEKNLEQEIPKSQFEYYKLYGSISKRFTLTKYEIPFLFSSEIDSQYSQDTLFGTEQFSVGGYYSVRGFRENFINGDSGYYARNKVNLNLGSLIAPMIKNNEDFFAKSLPYLNKISVEPFFDYGYVKNKFINQGADGRLSGAGIKTIFSQKYFNASLTFSNSISHSSLIESGTDKENKMIYFEISLNCC